MEDIRELLEAYKKGEIEEDALMEKLKKMPFEDLGFARVDHHRAIRKGFPEVIFCEGKTAEQITGIIDAISRHNRSILATRASEEQFLVVKKKFPDAVYNKEGRTITIVRKDAMASMGSDPDKKKGTILVVTAGTSDIPVAEEAAATAEIMGNRVERLYDCGVAGIHRLMSEKDRLMSAEVIIAVAGMEGALPSVIGGLVSKPIIAVPTSIGYGSGLGGISALLTMLNSCSPGITVVNIDNGFGAGYFAGLINR